MPRVATLLISAKTEITQSDNGATGKQLHLIRCFAQRCFSVSAFIDFHQPSTLCTKPNTYSSFSTLSIILYHFTVLKSITGQGKQKKDPELHPMFQILFDHSLLTGTAASLSSPVSSSSSLFSTMAIFDTVSFSLTLISFTP